MSADNDEPLEKTSIYSETAKVYVDPNYKVPPCLVLLVGPSDQMGRQWLIDQPSLTIGRATDADIYVADASVSKGHAKIEFKNNLVRILDLGSTNGTIVENEKLVPKVWRILSNNDQIRVANVIFKFLEHGILSETTEKARMQSELEEARLIQESLLPVNQQVNYQWVQIGGRYRAATECGGDWWWHWSIGDKAFAIIGDATGHGAGAALITSAARSAIASLENDLSVGVEKVYSTLSHALSKCSAGKVTMSAFIVEANLNTKKLRYINASHLPAVFLPKNNLDLNWRSLQNLIEPISISLGSAGASPYVGECEIPPQTRLVLLTDGLMERIDLEGKPLREALFFKMLVECHQSYPASQSEFLNKLIERSDLQAEYAPLADDITVVALDLN